MCGAEARTRKMSVSEIKINPEIKMEYFKKEKPPFLYHGSPNGEIEEFEPKISGGSGERYGALVYAAPDIATASIFMANIKGNWSAGRFSGVPYALIPMPWDKFIKNDAGGFIYVLPSDTFNFERGRGMGEYEWASKDKVVPIRKIQYPSALEAMLENGAHVYFVGQDTFRGIKKSEDHGLWILRQSQSENQKRGINAKAF